MQIDEIIENFEFLDDWDDRYKYLIELGNTLEPMADSEKNAASKVQGCVSQVWIVSETAKRDDGKTILSFRGDSDAHIVRGLIAITLAIFSGRDPKTIATTDEGDYFRQIGLEEHITPQRSNGLRSMVKRIKQEAQALTA